MIFVTVGMQLGFDRLIRAMDDLAPELGEEVIAQIGAGKFEPQKMAFRKRLSSSEVDAYFSQASLIVAHAGIGTVLAARRHAKPLVLLPRRADLGEHRNDHQVATVRQLKDRQDVAVAFEAQELSAAIARAKSLEPRLEVIPPDLDRLKQTIAIFIESGSLTGQK